MDMSSKKYNSLVQMCLPKVSKKGSSFPYDQGGSDSMLGAYYSKGIGFS